MSEPATAIQPQAEAVKPKTLAQKIAEVSAVIQKIKLTGVNADQKYKYLTIEAAVDAVRGPMQERGLLLTPNLVKMEHIPGDKGVLIDIVFNWTLEDTETGEQRTWTIPGSGWDYHDKGTFKAMTGSRKYALILIFNLPVGDNPEASAGLDRTTAIAATREIAAKKILEAAARGSQTAIDALSQIVPENKIIISRPEEHHGNYIHVSGMIAVPQLERFFDDTASKRYKRKNDLVPYWRIASEYEKGLIELCERLKIEVEG